MTAHATAAFHKRDPETGQVRFFDVGAEVPDNIAALVSSDVVDHRPVGTGADPTDGDAFSGEAFDRAVAAKVDEVVQEKVDQALEDQRNREAAAADAIDPEEPYDPSEDDADAVRKHLEGLDRDTVAGQREYDRVVLAEQDGKNRKTAIPAD